MRWTKEEISNLKENYEKEKYIKNIAKILGRSVRSVQHKTLRLGFKRPPVRLKGLIVKSKKEIDSKYYRVNKEEIQRRKRERIRKMKDGLIKAEGGKCNNCGYNKCNAALEFHHTNKDKEGCVTVLIGHVSKQKVLKEAKKCILLCANCHRELHIKDA